MTPEERREYDRNRYQLKRDETIARSIKWQQDNKEAHNAAVTRYTNRNPDVSGKAQRTYLDKNKGTVPFIQRNMLTRAKRRAKSGNYPFTITLGDIKAVWPTDDRCPVFGVEFDLSGNELQRTASLDKINPKLGYIKGNIVVVSFRANSIKQDSTLDELKVLLEYYTRISQ